MKKLLTAIVLTAMLMTMVCVPVSAHDKVTNAEWGTPVIDGVKEAVWDNAQSITVADEAITDAGDETAVSTVYSLWDGDFVYFYAVITDKTVDAEIKDDAWDQDAIGFMIDYAYNREAEVNYRNLGDDSYAGYVNVPAVEGEANYPEGPTIFGIAKYADAVKSYCKITATGWEVEIAIPLLYKEYKAGDKIGYEICQNNSIGEGSRYSQTVWSYANGDEGSNSWQYTANMGTLIFNEKPVEAAPEVVEAAPEVVEPAPEVEAAPEVTETAPVTTPAAQTSDIVVSAAILALAAAAVVVLKKRA